MDACYINANGAGHTSSPPDPHRGMDKHENLHSCWCKLFKYFQIIFKCPGTHLTFLFVPHICPYSLCLGHKKERGSVSTLAGHYSSQALTYDTLCHF